MNKITSIALALLLVVSLIAPSVLAEDTNVTVSVDANAVVTIGDDSNSQDDNGAEPMLTSENNDSNTMDDSNVMTDGDQEINDDSSDNNVMDDSSVNSDDSNNEVEVEFESETEVEVQSMHVPHGAQVRLLQLQKSITRNILVGEQVLAVIETNHTDANLDVANETLDKLRVTLNDVNALIIELNSSSTIDVNLATSEFVALKKTALDLTQEFRSEVKVYLTDADKEQIHLAVEEIDRTELNSINSEIRGEISLMKAERVKALLNLLNAPNPELIASIEAGTATNAEISLAIRTAYEALTPQERQAVNSVIKENVIKDVVKGKDILKKENERIREELKQRMEILRERAKQLRERMKEQDHQNGGPMFDVNGEIRVNNSGSGSDDSGSNSDDSNDDSSDDSNSGSSDDNGGDN